MRIDLKIRGLEIERKLLALRWKHLLEIKDLEERGLQAERLDLERDIIDDEMERLKEAKAMGVTEV